MAPRSRPIEDRFWEKVDIRGPEECWPWTGATSRKGGGFIYGHFRVGEEIEVASRVAYWLANGRWPEPMARHTCDTPLCVNPAHLIEGTHEDNMRDAVERGRICHGSAHHASKLTEEDILVIRERLRLGESMAVISRDYPVDRSAIWQIKAGKNWTHVA